MRVEERWEEIETKRGRWRERKRECVCVCVCELPRLTTAHRWFILFTTKNKWPSVTQRRPKRLAIED